MHFRTLAVAFVCAAVVGGVIAACGSDNGGVQTCTTDSNCSGGQICHPTAKQCVKTCQSPSDCPNTANFCAPFPGVGGDGGTINICQCTSDAQCAGGSTTGATVYCSPIDKICETKCSRDSDCRNGRTCNATTGQCGGGSTCTRQGTCGTNVCNFSNGNCEAPGSCSSGNSQPDQCHYGQYCASNCQEVPAPGTTCPNFGGSAHGLAWGVGSTGPIIYSVTKVSITNDAAFCGGTSAPTRFKVLVKAYATGSTTFASTPSGIASTLHLVDPNGSEFSATNTIQNVSTSSNGKNTQFEVNFCRGPGLTSYSAGMHFVNGNEICALIQ